MKEATGELNLTIIVIIAIGVLVAFFYFTLWPILNANFEQNSQCAKAACENPCSTGKNTCDAMKDITKVKCYVKGSSNPIYCPWKG